MKNPSDTPDCLLATEIVQQANELVSRLQEARVGIARLEGENARLRDDNAHLRDDNARLRDDITRLRDELDEANRCIAYLKGRLEEAGQRRTGVQRVENNYYNDRTTLIRDSGLPDASIQMQVLKKTSDNNNDSY